MSDNQKVFVIGETDWKIKLDGLDHEKGTVENFEIYNTDEKNDPGVKRFFKVLFNNIIGNFQPIIKEITNKGGKAGYVIALIREDENGVRWIAGQQSSYVDNNFKKQMAYRVWRSSVDNPFPVHDPRGNYETIIFQPSYSNTKRIIGEIGEKVFIVPKMNQDEADKLLPNGTEWVTFDTIFSSNDSLGKDILGCYLNLLHDREESAMSLLKKTSQFKDLEQTTEYNALVEKIKSDPAFTAIVKRLSIE